MKILIFVVVILSILVVSEKSQASEGEFSITYGVWTGL